MDALRGLPGVQNGLVVGERQAGQKQADAFRQALAQHGDGKERPPEAPPEPTPTPGAKAPAPSRLQRRAPASRKEQDEVRHIDVYA